jgi:hypothetical protein
MKDLLIDFRSTAEARQALHDLAQQYHDRCNAYDRMVCTGKSPRSGDVLPMNGRESGMVNRNARHVHEDIVRQGFVMGFTEKQIIEAIWELEDKA